MRISKKKKDYAEGKLVEVIEKAPYEIDAPCPHFGPCGGCVSQNLPYEKQLELKVEEVKELFNKAGVSFGDFQGIEKSPNDFGYRNKMEYSFGDMKKDGPLELGMHAKGSPFSVITVDKCLLVDEDFRTIFSYTLNYFRERNLPHYKIRNHEGYLRHFIIRKGINTNELLVNLVTSSQIEEDLTPYVEGLKKLELKGTLKSIIHTTNTKGAEKLYSIVKDFMEDAKDKVVFDLYCGTGTIGQIVAGNAEKVIGIELIEEAVAAANENAKLNGLNNCTFIAGDVAKVITEVKEKPDLIILDPPRSGVHPKALEYVVKFNAKDIIYVSCNPKTLVSDLNYLTNHGYEVVATRLMDMFANTPHVETVALLSKLNVDKHIDVEIKLDELDLTSAESKATYAQIKEYVLEKFGLKVSTLYIAQTKKKCGIEMREHYNKSKKDNQAILQCTPEKEEAIMDALRHFKMI